MRPIQHRCKCELGSFLLQLCVRVRAFTNPVVYSIFYILKTPILTVQILCRVSSGNLENGFGVKSLDVHNSRIPSTVLYGTSSLYSTIWKQTRVKCSRATVPYDTLPMRTVYSTVLVLRLNLIPTRPHRTCWTWWMVRNSCFLSIVCA